MIRKTAIVLATSATLALIPAWAQAQARERGGQTSGDAGPRSSAPPSGGSAGGGQAVPRGSSGGSGDSGGSSGQGSGGRTGATAGAGGSSGERHAQPARGTAREDRPSRGEAVPRTRDTGNGGGTTVVVRDRGYGGYYPWGYGGLGFGGYYAGYYDPWWYDDYSAYGYGSGYGYADDDGSLRIKVKPRDAAVYVDGYYAGRVDDFDGVFQRLRIESGPHRIEVRQEGYEPLFFDVRIQPDRTVTYSGELRNRP